MFDFRMSHLPRCRSKIPSTENRRKCAQRIVMMMPFWSGNDNNCLTPLVRIYTSQNPSQPTPIHLIKSHSNWFSSRCAFHFVCLHDVFACVGYKSATFANYNKDIDVNYRKTKTQHCGVFCVGYLLEMNLAGCVLLLIKMTFDSAVQRPKRQIDSTFCQPIHRISFCAEWMVRFCPYKSFTSR